MNWLNAVRGGLLSTVLLSTPGWGVELSDGTIAFEQSPRLENAYTTFSDVWMTGAKYYFTVSVPPDAGEPLNKIVIRQRGGVEDIDFRPDRTLAFLGTGRKKGEPLEIAKLNYDPERIAFDIELADAITPGETFTIGLRPVRNPRISGTYLFGVTVFPAGEKSQGLYLGPGRLTFYRLF
ncbi:MAG: DUF2808 domain-containing protein [Cyanobacteria bacterium P01_H01_bin.15]